MSENKKISFINGAAILSLAGILVKILGAIFRIPLASIVGAEGMGIYQLAYPMYSFLLVVSTAGFPVAISRLVAESVNTGDYKLAERTFRLSRLLMAVLGAVGMLAMILLSGVISKNQGNPDSQIVLIAIGPAILFVTILSAYRGYFQGLQNMVPTASTQVVEQLVKLLFGLGLAYFLSPYGVKYGALGAILGVTVSEVIATVVIIVMYARKRGELENNIKAMQNASSDVSSKKIIGSVLAISVPVAIGSAILPLVSMIDQLIVINGLKSVITLIPGIPFNVEEFAAYALKNSETVIDTALPMTELASLHPELYEKFITSIATSLYGIASGICSPIIALPLIFSTSLAISIVPAVSQAHALGNREDVCNKSATSFRLTTLIGFPCAIGLIVLAEPVIRTLYGSYAEWQILIAAKCLRIMSCSVFVLPLVHTSTAVLQGIGKQNIPVITLAIGAALFKVPMTYFLTKVPELNILGSALGTVAIFTFASIADIVCVCKASKLKVNIFTTVIKPLVISVLMGILTYIVYTLLIKAIHSVVISMGAAIVVAVLFYFALVLLTHSITKSDLEFVPKGELIKRKLGRFLGE